MFDCITPFQKHLTMCTCSMHVHVYKCYVACLAYCTGMNMLGLIKAFFNYRIVWYRLSLTTLTRVQCWWGDMESTCGGTPGRWLKQCKIPFMISVLTVLLSYHHCVHNYRIMGNFYQALKAYFHCMPWERHHSSRCYSRYSDFRGFIFRFGALCNKNNTQRIFPAIRYNNNRIIIWRCRQFTSYWGNYSTTHIIQVWVLWLLVWCCCPNEAVWSGPCQASGNTQLNTHTTN